MAAFQALGMVVYALSRNVVLAIASAIVIVLTGVAEGVAVYPVTLMGTSDTYGALGLSLFVLVLALFAAGCHRSAALLLGLVPAVHAGLGAWLWVVTIVILVWDGRPAFEQRRPAGKFFLAGCAVSAVSFAIQLVFITDVPPVDRLEVARTLNAFVSFWDYHRAPLQLVSRPMLFNIGAMAVAATGLLAFKRRVPPDATFFLEAVVVCGVLGLLAVFLSWIPSQLVPATLLMLMPSRVLTINTMVLAATVIGLSALLPRKALTTIVPVTLLAACVIYKPGLVIGRARGRGQRLWRITRTTPSSPRRPQTRAGCCSQVALCTSFSSGRAGRSSSTAAASTGCRTRRKAVPKCAGCCPMSTASIC